MLRGFCTRCEAPKCYIRGIVKRIIPGWRRRREKVIAEKMVERMTGLTIEEEGSRVWINL